ncbi:hypothetical protein GQR58_026021 [Nymphon striatum]|nr:hypothetical protein GQR58_026021 [Nymphon striatum]
MEIRILKAGSVAPGSPVLPMFVDAKNSALFYSMSTLYKPLGTAMLVHEMFNKENKQLKIHVGSPIPVSEFTDTGLSDKRIAKLLRKQLYRLPGKNKLPIFNHVQTIVHPAKRKMLKSALYEAQLLGETADGKKIFLYDFVPDSPVIHEIGRLRELSFRSRLAHENFSDKYKASYKQLNKKLKEYGVKVPALYKQYTEICKPGGCQFIAFNIDADFNYCIDSLILVDLGKIKEKRKQRYFETISGNNKNVEEKKTA